MSNVNNESKRSKISFSKTDSIFENETNMCALRRRGFKPQTDAQRAQALGDIHQLEEDMFRAVTIGIDQCFLPFPFPAPGDWVTMNDEKPQSVQDFTGSQRMKLLKKRNVIYVQPIGSFDSPRAVSLQHLCELSRPFFPGCIFSILPSISLESIVKREKGAKRVNVMSNQIQYSTEKIIYYLKKMKRKERLHDSRELFCMAVTMADIYPPGPWSFVYGIAHTDDGIGLFSFARLDPRFSDVEVTEPFTDIERTLTLKRAVAVFVHEVTHLFGIDHCLYYSCMMNGAESAEEMDYQPLYLCPICLRKMFIAFGSHTQVYNVTEMYENICRAFERYNFKDESEWYRHRLELLQAM